MIAPQRLQLSRAKGFNLQAASRALNGLPAVKVDRTTMFGNPCGCQAPFGCPHSPRFERWAWEDDNGAIDPLRCCVDTYRHYLETGLKDEPTRTGRLIFTLDAAAGYPQRKKLIAALPNLRDKNLACWCAPDALCHADVLLDIANRPIRAEAA